MKLLERLFESIDAISKYTVVLLVIGTIYLFAIYWQAVSVAARWPR